jgi:hypothetical protein
LTTTLRAQELIEARETAIEIAKEKEERGETAVRSQTEVETR